MHFVFTSARRWARPGASWLALGVMALALSCAPLAGAATAFNYQGRLADGGVAANGSFELRFRLHDASTAGNAVSSELSFPSVGVTNGLFTVALDFGTSPFNAGADRWLEVSARPAGSTAAFAVFSPRTPLHAVPYAFFALSTPGDASALVSGTVPDARLSPNMARIPDVLTSSNTLSDRVFATQADLQEQFNALSNRVAQLTAALPPQSSLVAPSLPGGLVIASPVAGDLTLLSQGLVQFAGFDAPSWTTGSAVGAPSARHGHASAWTGTQMFVWGGVVGGSVNNTGGAYEPGNDNWTSIATVNAPAARRLHSMAWTGERLLVWGGRAGAPLGDGGLYDHTNRTWAPITLLGAPSAREGPCAAWTGARWFIFGGLNADGLLNDGASYDPLGNLWIALPTANAPAARRFATATWCGDRVIVFGGEGNAGETDTGHALPMTGGVTHGTWSAISTTGAPSARQGHTAVWTGSRLIVWGGKAGDVPLGNGASYDPVSNTWTTLPTTLAPSRRSGHVAFWTGREMIVFGGEDATGALSTGAAYDPARNQWRYISGTGTPTARKNFTGAWTGSELVVFGGQSAGSPVTTLGTVQRLVPEAAWYLYRKP